MPTKKLNIHFIGIGGIGVSALAKYYRVKGHKISGSDITFGNHSAKNIPKNTNLVIYSPAVRLDNSEIKEAKRRNIKIQSYPEALGDLTKEYFTVAICGTHGKSTTTAMLGLLLVKAGLDPTIIVGTKLKEFGNSNCKVGKSKYLVIEACEYKESFLKYSPNIIVITNIEAEHLDYFKNLGNVKKAFAKFVKKLPKDGILITSANFNKQAGVKKLKKILQVPGKHNLENALAALAVARVLKVPDDISFKALSEYKGSWRRFEEMKSGKLRVISDYGHHPTEIMATLKAAREKYPKKQIWCVFQPHQYKRTHYLFNDFVRVFKKVPVNKVIITDIFDVAGREDKEIKKEVSSEKLVKRINKKHVIFLPKADIKNCLKENLPASRVLIVMGAGDIYKLPLTLS